MAYMNPLLAFMVTGISLLSLKPFAGRVGLLDQPGGRKTHFRATPLIGGLGIFTGIVISCLLTPGLFAEYAPLLCLSALVLLLGVIDDARELTPRSRLLGHSLIALAMALAADVYLADFGQIVSRNALTLGWLAVPITVFTTVGVINAVNMTDGVDGLSGSLVCVTLGFLAWLAIVNGATVDMIFLTLLICAILAFLSFNFRRFWHRPALVYLGDAGSTMLGFILAWLLISMSQGEERLFAPVFALWFLAVPLLDTVHLLIKRPTQGKSPLHPGTDHLHHQLLRMGFSVEAVVALLVISAILLGLVGMAGYFLGISDGIMFLAFLILFALYSITMDKISTTEPAY